MAKSALPKMPKVSGGKKKSVAESVPGAQPHKREASASEADRLARGRQLVAGYLVRRDGMDEEVAKMVVEGMEPETINSLVAEANTAVIERIAHTRLHHADQPGTVAASGFEHISLPAPEAPRPPASLDAPATSEGDIPTQGATLAAPVHRDFTEYPALMEWEMVEGEGASAAHKPFAQVVMEAHEAGKTKSAAEKEYKAKTAILTKLMRSIPDALRVRVGELKMTAYPGEHVAIDELKLIENGVDQAVINKCRVRTPWWAIKFSIEKPKVVSGE